MTTRITRIEGERMNQMILKLEGALTTADVVNLASRIEKLNKKYQSRLLVSENVWQSLEEDSTDAIPMGNVRVQGREKGIGIYQLA